MCSLLRQAFSLILPFLWQNRTLRKATIYTVVIMILHIMAHTATPWLLGCLLKQYQVMELPPLLGIVSLLLLCGYIGRAFIPLRNIVFAPVVNRAIRDIRMRVVMKLHQTPMQDWEQYGVAEIITANSRVYQSLRCFMNISLINVLPAWVNISFLTLASWKICPHTWYFTLLLLPIYRYVYLMMKQFIQLHRHAWAVTDQVNMVMDDSITSTRLHRFHLQAEEERLMAHFTQEEQYWSQNNLLRNGIPLVQVSWFTIVRGVLMLHLLHLLRNAALSGTDFIVIERYTALIGRQATYITAQIQQLLRSAIDLQKVLHLLSLPSPKVDKATQIKLTSETPVLETESIAFSYGEEAKSRILDVSLCISHGHKVAIIGDSGTGKSTLCALLAGLYTPQKGGVRLGGIPLTQLSSTTIGKHIHFINQSAILTSSVLTGAWGPHPVQGLDIATLKSRLQQTSGEIDHQLSGGEKQRIRVARALSYRPEILIMDETLNNLDPQSARELLTIVCKYVPTVILVTHQKALISDFTHVYQLAHGRLSRIKIN